MSHSSSGLLLAAGVALALAAAGCAPSEEPTPEETFTLESILASDPRLAAVAKNAEKHRLQIVLGLVEEKDGRPVLVQQTFRAGAEYFYPASTVKLFAAVAALETLENLRHETGLPLNARTPLAYHPQFEGEELVREDPTNLDGGPVTVAHEIRKLFLVSDNEAYNRLYELQGQQYLYMSLQLSRLDSAHIVHRLSEARTEEENRSYPRIDFLQEGAPEGAEPLYTLPERTTEPLRPVKEVPGLDVGRGYMSGGELIEEPMDFRPKNSISLVDLQRGLAKVVRPDVDAKGPVFQVSDADRAFLMEAMVQTPGESENPVYDPQEYPDSYVKFFLPGLEKVVPREHLKIYNKIGQAYGFTTENAYVVNTQTGQAFFLAATLYTNENGILNDDQYEYETVAQPFLAALGETVARELWR